MNFETLPSLSPRSNPLTGKSGPRLATIRAAVPDGSAMAKAMDEAAAQAAIFSVPPLPGDARETVHSLSQAWASATLSGKPFDAAKEATKLLQAHDAQTLAHYAGELVAAELSQLAAGAIYAALPTLFSLWSDRLQHIQAEHGAIVETIGLTLATDELEARRADRLDDFTEASDLREEYDRIVAAHVEARRLTDRDTQLRFQPAARYRGIRTADTLPNRVQQAFKSAPHVLIAATSLGWECWAPDPDQQEASLRNVIREPEIVGAGV